MTYIEIKVKSPLSSIIKKYINSTEPINEFPKNNQACKVLTNKPFFKTQKKLILKSFSEYDLFLPYPKSNNINTTSYKINKERPISNKIYPCKTINVIKKCGINSPLILNVNNKLGNNKKKCTKSLSSYSPNKKKKKLKLKIDEFLQNVKYKSPIDLLVEKKENELNIKYSHKPKKSNQKILSNFIKKNIKYIRSNSFKDNYYFIKSKLNSITKSTEKKVSNNENELKFDNEKYQKFRTISNNIKRQIKLSDKNLSKKQLLQQIKKEKNEMNIKRISQLKQDIGDNKILYTPKNFIKYRKDNFSYYKLNLLIKKLNCEFTYKNRFILSNKLDINLEDYLKK